MVSLLLWLWVAFLIISMCGYVYLINNAPNDVTNTLTGDGNLTKNKLDIFIAWLSGFLTFAGFILFIIWVIKFSGDKDVLKTIWIISLIICILSMSLVIFINNGNVQSSAYLVSSYTFIIFLGSLIGFFVRK